MDHLILGFVKYLLLLSDFILICSLICTFNIIENLRHASFFHAIKGEGGELKISSDCGESGRKKFKRGYGGAK